MVYEKMRMNDLVSDMLDKYEDLDRNTAEKDLKEFIDTIQFALD